MPKVSIIVPVYNAEKVIRRCVESVLTQEFTDFELILVDDGAKDSSPAILDEFAAKDDRVIVIHKENEGVSATRNRGIETAKGYYIQFMDADDWLTEDSTKILVRAAEEYDCDLVVGGFYRVVGEHLAKKNSIDDDSLLTLKEYGEYMMENPADYYYGVLWNKLYKKELIDRYHVRMDESLSFCEDFIFNLDYLYHCEKIRALNVPVYYYVKTEGGLVSQNLNPTRIVQMKLSVFQYYNEFFRDILDEEQYSNERISISKFLIAAANDDMVIPMMPGTRKLGEEKIRASFEGDTGNPLLMAYYTRKLFEKYLNTFAVRHELSLRDAWVFAAVALSGKARFTKSIADFTNMSELAVTASLQMMLLKGVLKQEYVENEMVPVYVPADPQMTKDLQEVLGDMRAVITDGFTAEETLQLNGFIERIDQKIKSLMVEK